MTDLLQLFEHAPSPSELADLRTALTPMLAGLSRALRYERALVALYDQRRETLRGTVGLNVPEPLAESLEVPLTQARHPLVSALLDGRPRRVDDVLGEPDLPEHDRALLLELGMRAFVVAPLRTGIAGLAVPDAGSSRGEGAGSAGAEAEPSGDGTTIRWRDRDLPAAGVVLLSKEGTITDEDIEWLMPFANQAGVALARASDVERLRSASEQFAIENEWLWAMVNAVDDPVVVTDAENTILLPNRRAETIFRASPGDSEGKRHAIWMNNFLFTAWLSAWNLEQGRRGISSELTLVDPIEGTELLFEVIGTPVHHFRLARRGMVWVLKDVTDLRRATEQLTQNLQRLQAADEEVRQERDRLDLIIRSVPNPILVLDLDNQPIRMNQEALRLFQRPVPAHEASERSNRRQQVVLSNDAKFTSFLAQLRLDPGTVKSGELMLVDPDTEETLEMWVTVTELRDELGALAAVLAVMHNLAPLRELERRRVEQALFESEKLAATGRLAASIAHEINNPLEAIKNSLYLVVSKTSPDDPNYRFLEIARRETERVSRILSSMLGFYRPAVSMVPTDLNALIEEAESLLHKHLIAGGVRVRNELSRSLPPIKASPDQLKQVILNLLLNAQQAMPQGGTIVVSTRAGASSDAQVVTPRWVQLQIRDTGTGIAPEHLPHIFEPFFSTKQDQKGTGLGLWVSNGIVRSHGGKINVRSRPGEGTTFTITLPVGGPPDNE